MKNRNAVFLVLFSILAWVILNEEFSALKFAAAVLVSIGCVYYCYKFLPLSKITGVKAYKLITYPFYLIGQIYLAGIQAIRLILMESEVNIVKINTEITNDLLKVILANSITLIPGTVSLDLKDESITVLWLRRKNDPKAALANADELIKGNLEKKLIKAQG